MTQLWVVSSVVGEHELLERGITLLPGLRAVPEKWYKIVEIGFDQADSVSRLFTDHHFNQVGVYHDLTGHARVVVGQK